MKLADLKLPDEPLRLEIKQLAEDVRYKYSKKGLSDIFDIVAEEAFLMRLPLDTNKISGFSTFLENKFIVFLNSSFTLGHERYSAAHELYHIIYNADVLKKEKLMISTETTEEDFRANIFAAEFLMPEDYVKEIFYKIINLGPDEINEKHVVRMNNSFKVSYKAMLKRLIQLGLCNIQRYNELIGITSIENAQVLQELTKREGYDTALIVPSKIKFIPKEYIEFVKANYENNNISFKNMKKCFEFIGLSVEHFGYEYPELEGY